ncbi:hypothetical protein EHR_02305 [Enterococcus hirae ATCC 9790]|uniref:Uncharacterized protein n=1 Tax=Enterococcus hirae (strain ATCC 9790 / DSM 20160 / JCM 8729 / LMG 6399 / NBRC 3181 / NCIMB 6459 / NCDO 1258 / NCTC 12367 / WDCM 00089 / R) TaxID=768486 RepID=I6SA61_ENTHA|nr:hypothetical protein EHR_02305 [Enterococcus hirae ATCC 9790]
MYVFCKAFFTKMKHLGKYVIMGEYDNNKKEVAL